MRSVDQSERLDEQELYRFGHYAIGRSGRRPVISLPKTRADQISRAVDFIEKGSIILYLISAALLLVNRIGITAPFVVGLIVIILRGITILISNTVVARTVHDREKTGNKPEVDANSGVIVFDDVQMEVSINSNSVGLHFTNNSLYEVTITVNVTAAFDSVVFQQKSKKFTIPTHHSIEKNIPRNRTHHNTSFDFDITKEVDVQKHNEIRINVGGTRLNTDEMKNELLTEREIQIPIEISNREEILQDEYEYEVLAA